MFKKPFDESITTKNLLHIDKADTIQKTESFRVYPIKQENLLKEGLERSPEDEQLTGKGSFVSGKYEGNKWGGKYLRAPDIFFTIMEKGKHLIAEMSAFFEGERYLNTGGADDFFIISNVVSGDKNSDFYEVTNNKDFKISWYSVQRRY